MGSQKRNFDPVFYRGLGVIWIAVSGIVMLTGGKPVGIAGIAIVIGWALVAEVAEISSAIRERR